MQLTPTSIVAALGRGAAFPWRVADGGTAWNLPVAPTFDDCRLAARGSIRACARVEFGSVVMRRAEGSLIGRLRGSGARQAVFDAVMESIQLMVGRHVRYVEKARVTGVPAATGTFDGLSGLVTLRCDYQFARSIELVTDDVNIGRLTGTEAQRG